MLVYLYHHDGNDILNCAPSCLTIVVLVANFSVLCLFKKPRVEFFHFGLDLCIVNKGEKVMDEKCCCMHLEGVPTG